MSSRYVTAEENPAERYRLYRLCECAACHGVGKDWHNNSPATQYRCAVCRGEGRTRDLVAACDSPEALGLAIVTLAREQEFEGCPIGILDTQPEPGGMKWLVRPWQPSTRNVSDAARVLARSKGKT